VHPLHLLLLVDLLDLLVLVGPLDQELKDLLED